jgi:hypothetical protein
MSPLDRARRAYRMSRGTALEARRLQQLDAALWDAISACRKAGEHQVALILQGEVVELHGGFLRCESDRLWVEHSGWCRDDLLQAIRIYALEAAGRYDPHHAAGASFPTYIKRRLPSIRDAELGRAQTVRASEHRIKWQRRIYATAAAFLSEHQREPTDQEIADLLAVRYRHPIGVGQVTRIRQGTRTGLIGDATVLDALIEEAG